MDSVGFLIYNYYRNSFGKYILGRFFASVNNGAICDGLNPAMPHPMGVTKNLKSGCFLAKSLNYPQAKDLWDSDFIGECLRASLTPPPSV